MAESIRLAFDAMSGDFGPRITIPAALAFAESAPLAQLLIFGDSAQMAEFLPAKLPQNISLHPSGNVIAMDAAPREALRQAQGSSMSLALQAVAKGEADACVSAGNSGALMLLAKRALGTLPGVDLPAFCKSMPVERNATVMLDLGGNVQCSAEQLVQFARMGSVLAGDTGSANVSVGLLNIGIEAGKGTRVVREAAALLEVMPAINYVGYVEADEIFTGRVAVIVCDGFSGNIALKASEGVARLIARRIEKSFASGFARVLGLILWPVLRHWRRELNPDAYNGATLVGLAGTVIKSHGGAGVQATVNALTLAYEQARLGVPAKIRATLGD